jgi:hypothetical protein
MLVRRRLPSVVHKSIRLFTSDSNISVPYYDPYKRLQVGEEAYLDFKEALNVV